LDWALARSVADYWSKPIDIDDLRVLLSCSTWKEVLMIQVLEERIPLVWGAKRLRLAVEAAGVALFSWNVDNDLFEMDDRGFFLWGVTPSGAVKFEALSRHIHPADRARVRAAFAATCAIGGEYEIDFRVTTAAGTRWISARGKGNDTGFVDRVLFGIFLDVSDRKQAEESHELLAGEMSHRVKNLLAIASGLTAITARSSGSVPEMAKSLTQRLLALGRAHDVTRQVPYGQAQGALLGDLLSVLLAPYADEGDFRRVRVKVPKVRFNERSATSLALVIHELATNSLKYGSLSAPSGILDLSHRTDGDEFVLLWTEREGPPVFAPTGPSGFGSTLISRSMAGQLGGSIDYDWSSNGVTIALRIDSRRLS
jgi:two-component sensor histidine kinase